jgi:hypothetical protein
MIGFDLSENYHSNPEALLRKKRTLVPPFLSAPPTVETVTLAPSTVPIMAKTLHDYSTLTVANVPVGPAVNVGNGNFELRTGLIMMVQSNQFHGLLSEYANAHLQHFLKLCDTIVIKDVALESIRLCLFPFSL